MVSNFSTYFKLYYEITSETHASHVENIVVIKKFQIQSYQCDVCMGKLQGNNSERLPWDQCFTTRVSNLGISA